ncbi:hypothetical protein GCM10010320_67620 [Streptomyces caelestis]|nr:hypothetical protein GCM10010320_67620 [Streptomyces caelestis]
MWPPAATGRPRRQAASLRPRDLQRGQHVERCINRLKQWRGITTRYDKAATIYLAGLHIAGIFLWSADDPNKSPSDRRQPRDADGTSQVGCRTRV